MALTIISGKPGSGKSYYMMMLLVAMFADWLRYELKHNKPFDSSLWTNMVINIDGMNETLSKRLGKEVDVSHYIRFCDDSFFHDAENVYWWRKFPAKALIVIDEVHIYLSPSMEYGSLDLEMDNTNWLSTHRHGQQDLFFITQHPDQFPRSVLGIADSLVEVVNLKSLTLPFPFSIPMSDLDELKKSFGIKSQYFQVNNGNFRGKAIRWDGTSTKHLMSSDIFRVYKSHDAGLDSDRPELEMSPFEGLCWFFRRHAWHLLPKAAVVPAVLFLGVPFILDLPKHLMAASAVQKEDEVTVTKSETFEKVKEGVSNGSGKEGGREGRRDSGSGSGVGIGASGLRESGDVSGSLDSFGRGYRGDRRNGGGVGRLSFADSSAPALSGADVVEEDVAGREGGEGLGRGGVRVVMLFAKGVMLNDGRKIAVGDTFDYEGAPETLACVNVDCGIVGFESGKKVRF